MIVDCNRTLKIHQGRLIRVRTDYPKSHLKGIPCLRAHQSMVHMHPYPANISDNLCFYWIFLRWFSSYCQCSRPFFIYLDATSFHHHTVKPLNSRHNWFSNYVSAIERCLLQWSLIYKGLTITWDTLFPLKFAPL